MEDPNLRGTHELSMSVSFLASGAPARALTSAEGALRAYRMVDNDLGCANALLMISKAYLCLEEPGESHIGPGGTVETEVAGAHRQVTMAWLTITSVRLAKEKGDASLKEAAEALALFRRCGSLKGQSEALCASSCARFSLAQYDAALQDARDAVRAFGTCTKLEERRDEAVLQLVLGRVLLAMKQYLSEALVALVEARRLFRSAGEKQGESAALMMITEAHIKSGAPDKALRAALSARAVVLNSNPKFSIRNSACLCLQEKRMYVAQFIAISEAYFANHLFHDALVAATEARRAATNVGDRRRLAVATLVSSEAQLATGALDEALEQAVEAREALQVAGKAQGGQRHAHYQQGSCAERESQLGVADCGTSFAGRSRAWSGSRVARAPLRGEAADQQRFHRGDSLCGEEGVAHLS